MHPTIAYQLALTLCDEKRYGAPRAAGRRADQAGAAAQRPRAPWLAKLRLARAR